LKQKIILTFLTLTLFVLFVSCEDEPSSIGIEFIAGDLVVVKTFDSQVDSVTQTSSFFKNVIPLGLSNYILTGKYQDIEASTLVKFIFGLEDSLKTDVLDGNINVLDSWIVLTNRYVYGDTLASMDFTAHKVNSSWSYSDFTIDSLSSLQYESDDISTNLEISDTTYVFQIDESLVLSWMKNAADNSLESNYGIYLKPTDMSSKVIGFQALTTISTAAAKLFVVIEKEGVYADTINGFVIGDISLVDGNLPSLPAGIIGMQSSIAINSKLTFDVSELPKGLVVNSAELILMQDTVNSVQGSVFSNNLRAYFLTSSDSLNTEGNSTALTYNDKKFSGNISGFIRSWIATGENYGLLIQPGIQIDGLELFAIYGSDAAEYSFRPRLRVTYTTKAGL
jgi:hypothetical protein